MSELSSNGVVAYDIEDGVAWVRFNRPDKRNCMSPTLNRDMIEVLDALEYREHVSVLVLSGEGTSWSAGMDLKEYFRENEAKGLGATRQAQREAYGWWRRLRWYQKPTIAMVNGWCFGGGYGPLFGCDLAFAAEEATFGLSEINWGILPGGGASKVAVELLPFRKAMYHAMMGENIDGKTAAEWGLVNEALPLAALRARVSDVAQVLKKKNPVALKATKDAIRRVSEMTYENAEDYLIRAQEAANSYDNDGRKEGIKQFIDDKTYKPGLGAYDMTKQGVKAMAGPVDDIALQAMLGPQRLAARELTGGRDWTYARLDRDIGACAAVLAGRGIKAGDRVAALARNCVLLPILHHACARLGAIYVPLNWRLADPELAWLIGDAEPALLVADRPVGDIAPDLTVEQLDAAVAATAPLSTAAIDREAISLILYTSGTSGRPKGAMLSERAIGETAINLGLYGAVTRDSRFLIDSPMFHVIGIVSTVRPPWMFGGAILVSDGFEAPRTLARIADPDLGVTHYFGVPQMAAMLRAVPGYRPDMLHGLTGFFTGGAPFPADDLKDFVAQGVPLSHGFGMSECGTFSHTPLDPALVEASAGSSGLPTPRTQMRLVDDGGAVLPHGGVGELQIRGANLFSGYWRREEASGAAFTADGWFATGDMARIDEHGFLWIVDRKKDMFISGGENVYPAEIEAAVAGLAGLAEAAVIGVPDARWGEVGHLAVVALPGAALAEAAVRAHLEGRLARYKLPKYISVLDALPRTGSGKVVKAQLRAQLLERVEA